MDTRFPHRRGGVPCSAIRVAVLSPVFPTGVGVYRMSSAFGRWRSVFPTGVGVYRIARLYGNTASRFPHRRGGVPNMPTGRTRCTWFSPQAWGCTEYADWPDPVYVVFPTGVGVYRSLANMLRSRCRFPHRRGGVPDGTRIVWLPRTFSPQAWGCTAALPALVPPLSVFPTGVGVYRPSFSAPCAGWAFSPQAWGCTGERERIIVRNVVFPTGVGVYRHIMHSLPARTSFPHRRGGVPTTTCFRTTGTSFSPQAWGCTGPSRKAGTGQRAFSPQAWGCTGFNPKRIGHGYTVFPTGVGVYRLFSGR